MATPSIEKAQGDPDQLRSAARSWGSEASSYNAQVIRLQRVQGRLPASAFTGAQGEQMRTWLTDTINTTTALRSAYGRIAGVAPFVADAIEDTKQAEKHRDDAKQDEDDARRVHDQAAADVVEAQLVLLAARVIGGGASARAEHQLETAQRRLSTAEHDLATMTKVRTRADERFRDARAAQKRKTEAFAKVLHEQTAIINRALPSAPPAPSVSPVLSELKVLGYGREALKGLIDLQEKAVRTYLGVPERVSIKELRAIRAESGESLGKLLQLGRSKFGPLTELQSRNLEAIEKISGRIGKVNTLLGGGLTLTSKTVEALNDPHLSAQQKQDQIVNRFLLEFGLGTAAAAACSPGLVAATACGTAGTQLGTGLEKSHLIRRATNGFSHIVVSPHVEAAGDLVHGQFGEGVKDTALLPVRIPYNLVTQTFPTRERVAGLAKDAGDDGKSIFLAPGRWASGVARKLRVP